jgi:hypothetical protein
MALSFVAASQGYSNGTTNLQFSHTISAGSDRLCVVGIGLRTGSSSRVSSVTFGGQTVTNHFVEVQVPDGPISLWIGSIDEALLSDGAATLSINLTSSTKLAAGIVEYSGVSQNDWPFKNFEGVWADNETHTTGSNSSYTTSTDSDGLALGFLAAAQDAGSAQTKRVDRATGSPKVGLVMTEVAGDGGNKSMTFTHGDVAYIVTANCLQVPQNVSLTPTFATTATSALIGTVDDGNITLSNNVVNIAASATIGSILESQLIEADMMATIGSILESQLIEADMIIYH